MESVAIETNRFKRKVEYTPVDRTRRVVPVRDISEPSRQIVLQAPAALSVPEPEAPESRAEVSKLQPVWAPKTLDSSVGAVIPASASKEAVSSPFERSQLSSSLALRRLKPSFSGFNPIRPLKRMQRAFWRVYTRLGLLRSIAAALAIGLLVVPLGYRLLVRPNSVAARVAAGTTTNSLPVSQATASASQLTNPASALSAPTTTNASATLNFTPVVPTDESQLADLGSNAFVPAHDSYTFDDLFLAEPLQVSEQPVPSGYSSVASAVSKVANSLHATTQIAITGGTAYLATDSSTKKQTVVLSMNDLLLFIQSDYPHTVTQWQAYIGNLR